MKNLIAGIVMSATAVPAFASDLSGNSSFHPPEGFSIVYISTLDKIKKKDVQRLVTPEGIERVQAEIGSDNAVSTELLAHHVQLKNVVASQPTMSGNKIYYVK